ncbi:MAG: hypothetical protein WC238_02625 [Parcubacteria group bacterium]|jgi:hypothetical protein
MANFKSPLAASLLHALVVGIIASLGILFVFILVPLFVPANIVAQILKYVLAVCVIFLSVKYSIYNLSVKNSYSGDYSTIPFSSTLYLSLFIFVILLEEFFPELHWIFTKGYWQMNNFCKHDPVPCESWNLFSFHNIIILVFFLITFYLTSLYFVKHIKEKIRRF